MWFIDLIKGAWAEIETYILPFIIVHTYERGVVLTFGKNPKLLNPGIRPKLPFFQVVFTTTITTDTMDIKPVLETTTDGKTILVKPIVEFSIDDPIKWLMDTNEARSNLHDISGSVVSDYLTDIDWEECKKKTTLTKVKNKLQARADSMGAKIHSVSFASMCLTRVIITQA